MVHPQGEVLSFPPLRFSRGDFPAADLNRLAALYRPLLPRPKELENVALSGPLLYHSTDRLNLSHSESDIPASKRDETRKKVVPRLEVIELYNGKLPPRRWYLRNKDYGLGLWAIGSDDLQLELAKLDRVGLYSTRLALLAAPIWKAGRKKRQFHQLQMEHRQHILDWALRFLLPQEYRYLTPSGGAMLLLDTVSWFDPLLGTDFEQAFISSPEAQRNKNALYRRINWLFEKYPIYRRAGYKGGEAAYAIDDRRFVGEPSNGIKERAKLTLSRMRATSPYNHLQGTELSRLQQIVAPLKAPSTCINLFKFNGHWLDPYLLSRVSH